MLSVSILPLDATETDDVIDFDNVDYVSFVNEGTYGKPAIIAPGTEGYEPGRHAVRVLYVNTGGIAACEVVRHGE